MRRCPDPACGLLWLDPVPLEEDIHLAYARYYTHERGGDGGPGWRPWYRGVVRAYLARRFGYPGGPTTALQRLAARVVALHPIRREDALCSVLYLGPIPGGTLLDVGAGSGTLLRWMGELGWQVQGVDPDPRAVEAARARGLTVYQGSLDELALPDASFDAVTLSHVVEHVFDPRALLTECRRVLRPGGRLSVLTPNAAGQGHRTFGSHWRGLEPPRHIHVFTPGALEAVARDAGFGKVEVRTTARDTWGTFLRSRYLRAGHSSPAEARPSLPLRVWARSRQWRQWALLRRRPGAGDEIALVAVR